MNARGRGFFTAGMIVIASAFSAHALSQSAADCAAIADRESRYAGSTFGGAARGAARGALFGAVVGGDRKGARRGAALGAVVGGARRAGQRNQVYERIFDDCMRRGYPGYYR